MNLAGVLKGTNIIHFEKGKKIIYSVRFQVFTAASIKFTVFRDVPPCSHIQVDRRFRGAYCLHHQGNFIIYSVLIFVTNSVITYLILYIFNIYYIYVILAYFIFITVAYMEGTVI
jgi:hypothetical protein